MKYRTHLIILRSLKSLCVIIALGLIMFMIYIINRGFDTYSSKRSIQIPMRTVISNGGSIDEVRHIYETRSFKEIPWFVDYSDFIDSSYRSDVPLSHMLSDLLVEYYKDNSRNKDTLYIERLKNIVADYNAVHPFDALEEEQKYYLENIRQKLDTNYFLIQDDILKIGDELDRKNLLVSKYLDKSELSFWISIVAVAITILLSWWQINQNIKSGKKLDRLLPSEKNKGKEDAKPGNVKNE